MKTIFSFSALMLITCMLLGQEVAVPKSVIRAFNHQYRSAESATWYVEQDHFEVQFLDGVREKVAFYAKSDGKLIQTKILIDENEIPNAVMQAIRSQYPVFDLKDYSRIVRPDDSVYYSISLKNPSGSFTIGYSDLGDELSKEKLQ